MNIFLVDLVMIVIALFGAVIMILATFIPTFLIELPIIYFGKITKNVIFIAILNLLTNVLFNIALILLCYICATTNFSFWPVIIFYAFAELLVIPLFEAGLYRKISDASSKRIIAFSYLANIASCLPGVALSIILSSIY